MRTDDQVRRTIDGAPRVRLNGGKIWRPEVHNAAAVWRMQLPETRWIVPEILPEGLTVLAGMPKTGKSWLALDVATAVAGGGRALGSLECEPGSALLIGLEDSLARLQRRHRMLLGEEGDPPLLLDMAVRWPRQNEGGIETIEAWLDTHPDGRLVVVDTWARFKPARGKGAGAYEADYAEIEPIQRLAAERRIAVVLIHHAKKNPADDWINELSGSTGLTGAADTIMLLKKTRGELDAILHVTGRDVEEQEKALRFDATHGQWVMVGEATEYQHNTEKNGVLEVLRKSQEPLFTQEIADYLDKDKATVKKTLQRLMKAGLIERLGSYHLPRWKLPNRDIGTIGTEGMSRSNSFRADIDG